MFKKIIIFISIFAIVLSAFLPAKTTLAGLKVNLDFTVDLDSVKKEKITAGASVHDPSIIKADEKYYLFGSHMVTAVSEDMRHFELIGTGYNVKDTVYLNLMKNKDAFAYAGSMKSLNPTDNRMWHVWAPHVIYNKDAKQYFLYFCMSSTWNTSNLCYATSDNIDGPYEWQGALLYSGFTPRTLFATDVRDYVNESEIKDKYKYINENDEYNSDRYPNAIDPAVLYDKDGRLWMTYGSWSGGIFITELDKKTGVIIHAEADEKNRTDPYFGKQLIGGNHNSIEGSYILYDKQSDYYYMFVSYGGLVREGGYQIRVFRSKTIDGDYTDMNGKFPLNTQDSEHGKYGLKLSGNYNLPSLDTAYMATGHNSAFIDDDGKKYIAFHTRFDNKTEKYEPRIHQFILNENKWPCMLPYATDGETVCEKGYSVDKMSGRYYVINQGTAIDAEIAQPCIMYLDKDGKAYGENFEGTWKSKENTYYMNISYNGKSYNGIFCEMNDEAGTPVFVFSAVGENESVWGIKY